MSLFPALCGLLTVGCAHQPGAFRLVIPPNGAAANTAPGNAATLIPPDAKDVTATRAALRTGPIPRKTVCPPSPHGLFIQRKWLASPRVIVTSDTIGTTTGPELFAWTVQLERQGCIPTNEAFQLAENVIDALPLGLAKRSQLLQARADLKSVDSLRLVTPIYKEGTSAGAPEVTSISQGASPNSISVDVKDNNTIGYEIAWYDLLPESAGPGYRIVPRSTEVHIDGSIQRPSAPAHTRFQADPQARWYQLFMMTKISENDFDFVVLSSRTSAQLHDDVATFQRDSAAFLRSADPASYTVLPHGVGINAYVKVRVNGVVIDLMRGSAVRHALLQASLVKLDPRTVPSTLKVRKLHDGKLYPVRFDRTSDQILSLPLEGGEEIDW
jgi:hypothetical protein